MGKYDEIMQHLNPKVIIEKTEIPHDNARANCTLQSSIVGSYSEFEDILIAYVAHHTQEIFGMPFPPEYCLDKARKFLDNSIGFENAAYIAMSGADGGMNHILNEVNNGFKAESRQAYFSHIITQFIDPLDFQEIVELMSELKEKIGGYSPESFQYIPPEQMAGSHREILWSYIDSLSKYRNLWAY